MSDPAASRLERDIENLMLRVRSLENVDTPRQRELVAELHELRQKVVSMDVMGTEIMRVRLAGIQDDLNEIRASLLRQDAEKRADRRVMLGALLAAATAIALAIFQAVRP